MSGGGRSYDNFLEKGAYTYICENKLIQGNEKLNIVVNPGGYEENQAKILFTKSELIAYCLQCNKRDSCDQETKDSLLNILGDKREISK